MQVSFRSNLREVERGLSDLARKQVPFATSLALNATAGKVAEAAGDLLTRRLDRPTPFTQRAFAVRRSSRATLAASVFAKDAQAAYLTFAESGGERAPKKRANVIPAGLRLNSFGNMPRGAIKRALARPDVFSGRPKGGKPRPPGIYERTGKGGRGALRRLVLYTGAASYSPRLGFAEEARRVAEANMAREFEASLRRALATAR